MATTVTIAGQSYSIPSEGDSGYATDLTNFFIQLATSTKVLQVSSSTFPITQDLSFGNSFGLKALNYKTQATNPASTGQFRLGNNESVSWRNAGNTADLSLKVDATDNLNFNGTSLSVGGTPVQTAITVSDSSTIDLKLTADDISGSVVLGSIDNSHIATLAAIAYSKLNLTGSVVNADINASAAIAYSKLNLTSSVVDADISPSAAISLTKIAAVTASRALISDGSGHVSPSAVTSTELSYVSGVTSAIQTQLNTKAPTASPTFTGTVTGITAAMVGLPNVDNTSDATKNSAVATLTNKTLTAPVIDAVSFTDQGSTPSTPAAGTHKAYVKTSTGKLTILDSSGNEVTVGSGSSAVNYITNGDAEAGTTGWVTYKDAAAARPVDGTGGSPTNVTFTRSTTAPLASIASFLFTKAAANAQGEGASYDFTINAEDKAKVLTITMSDMVSSGTFTAGTSTTDSDVIVYLYDITNGTLIEPSSFKFLANSTTIADKFQATFQTNSNSTSYRLILHCATTSTSAFALKLDSISVSPSVYVFGTPITDFQSYTPTFNFFGSVTSVGMFWKREGDCMVGTGSFTIGTTSAGAASFTLPNGMSVDTSKLSVNNTTAAAGHDIGFYDTANPSQSGPLVTAPVTNPNLIYFGNNPSGTNGTRLVPQSLPVSSSQVVTVNFRVPIQGWSSSVQTSDQTDTRVVAANAFIGTQNPAAGTDTVVQLQSTLDTHGSWNNSTYTYTVVVPGIYKLDATVTFGGFTPGTALLAYIYKNGVELCRSTTSTSSGGATASIDRLVNLVAGDTIKLLVNTGSGNANGINNTNLSITRLSGPSAIAASEKLLCKYSITSNTAFSANTPLVMTNKIFDTHSIYNTTTGLATAPTADFYKITVTGVASTTLGFYAGVNGTGIGYIGGNPAVGVVYSASTTVYVLAGQTFGPYTDSTGTFTATSGGGPLTTVLIERVK